MPRPWLSLAPPGPVRKTPSLPRRRLRSRRLVDRPVCSGRALLVFVPVAVRCTACRRGMTPYSDAAARDTGRKGAGTYLTAAKGEPSAAWPVSKTRPHTNTSACAALFVGVLACLFVSVSLLLVARLCFRLLLLLFVFCLLGVVFCFCVRDCAVLCCVCVRPLLSARMF